MVEGLKFHMTSEQMKDYLVERVAYHGEREAFYKDQALVLRARRAEGTDVSDNPVKILEDKAVEHRRQLKMFQFMRDHLILGDTYQLSEADLRRLEIIDRGF